MINLKSLIVGLFTALVLIILLYIKIRDRLNKKKEIQERKTKNRRKFKKKS